MKKMLQRSMALLLAVAMIVCVLPSNAKAAVSTGQTLTSKDAYAAVALTGNPQDTLIDVRTLASKGQAQTLGIAVQFAYTSEEKLDNSYAGRIFPVTFSAPGYILLESLLYSGSTGARAEIYADAACTSRLGYASYMNDYGTVDSEEIAIPAAGTYYIKVSQGAWQTFTNSALLAVNYYPNKEYTLTSGVIYQIGCQDSAEYIKYKAKSNGYVTFELFKDDNYIFDTSMYVEICNSGKKSLSRQNYLYTNDASIVFGVKKGVTYYFKVTSASGLIAIRCTEKSVSEKSGSKLKKAKTLSKNKKVTGVIAAGDKTADWYKIKVTKSSKLTFTVSGSCTGSFKLTLYKSNGKKWATGTTMINDMNDKDSLKTNKKVSKGTYYIKVERTDSKSTGYYTLKWK